VPPHWQKRGLLIAPPLSRPWAQSHAALPVADPRGPGAIDVFFSPRDGEGRAHVAIGHVRVNASTADLALEVVEPEPILSPGSPGAFDESGVTISCVVHDHGATFLYYTGWTLGVTVPFYLYVGLAVRRAGAEVFERVSPAPMLERTSTDPYLTASPWVLCDNGRWRMWYVSCVDWVRHNGAPRHRYHICYAESDNGVDWQRDGRVSIDFANEREYAISRPCVIRDDDRYRMWFAARGERYLLGYAESADGLAWARDDSRAGLGPSTDGWDSEMVAYPAVFDCAGQRYLLYNGNGYGRSGIGYAVQREPTGAPSEGAVPS
jgi:hypothetical protein